MPLVPIQSDDPLTFLVYDVLPFGSLDRQLQGILSRFPPGTYTAVERDQMQAEVDRLFEFAYRRVFRASEIGTWLRETRTPYVLDGTLAFDNDVLELIFLRPADAMLFKLRWG